MTDQQSNYEVASTHHCGAWGFLGLDKDTSLKVWHLLKGFVNGLALK
jgi:hypothetical protein